MRSTLNAFSQRAMCLAMAAVISLTFVGAHSAGAKQTFEKSAAGAKSFVDMAEKKLLEKWIENERAAWIKENFITHDTELNEAKAYEQLLGLTRELAQQAAQFNGLDLDAGTARKLNLIKISLPLASPADPAKQRELSQIASELSSLYAKGKYCPEGKECMDLGQLSEILATSRDADEMLDAWRGWRTISPEMRSKYQRFVELANEGAKNLGFADLGELWRSGYDMPPSEFPGELDRLWQQVRPLYDSLHCYVRSQLAKEYGNKLVKAGEPIPAHLLGNMWAQSWGNTYDMVAPKGAAAGYDLTKLLSKNKVDEVGMARYGERFFSSLGLEPLPETFWDRSLFKKPADRDVVCHASAWNLDWEDDLRIKMCIKIDAEDFVTVHHELGHNYYQRAYKHLDPLYRDSANDGFHEAIGDTVALSVTPSYLKQVGLLNKVPGPEGDLSYLMRQALDKVAFMPFGLLIDQWRWKVFSGEISPADYNKAWWELREKYQGVAAPVSRDESSFDPGAKYHVPSNVPYTRYFLAHILQFQFHRGLCKAAGFEGPLHRCSVYGNDAAGARLRKTLEMGLSEPWPDALEAMTGERDMDATAVLEYFKPLHTWLDEQNEGQTCGW